MGMSLGQFISIRRKRMLMTQEELAKKTNVSKSAIAKWETDGGFQIVTICINLLIYWE